jgi:16S rRNA (guanine(966)-N(2))-methyltransferase RsmD
MRIIAGSFKGRKLVSPKGLNTRPTSDRVREAIFSIIGDIVEDARVLDLYSGTGAMGLEALSRGASQAVFVETDQAALRCLQVNIEAVGCRERTRIINRPVLSYLEKTGPNDGFDLVFADPPYAGDLGTLTLKAISKHAKPLKGCLIILEHAPGRPPETVPDKMDRVDTRKYGNTGVTFLAFD